MIMSTNELNVENVPDVSKSHMPIRRSQISFGDRNLNSIASSKNHHKVIGNQILQNKILKLIKVRILLQNEISFIDKLPIHVTCHTSENLQALQEEFIKLLKIIIIRTKTNTIYNTSHGVTESPAVPQIQNGQIMEQDAKKASAIFKRLNELNDLVKLNSARLCQRVPSKNIKNAFCVKLDEIDSQTGNDTAKRETAPSDHILGSDSDSADTKAYAENTYSDSCFYSKLLSHFSGSEFFSSLSTEISTTYKERNTLEGGKKNDIRVPKNRKVFYKPISKLFCFTTAIATSFNDEEETSRFLSSLFAFA